MHRSGEITYYEELGVEPDATHEQIRDCFRSMVRLLHPDQQTDPQLKEIAGRQMRKLNHIYSVLSDPERRRRYDDLLQADHRGPTIVFGPSSAMNLRRLAARLAWVGAAIAIVGGLVWFTTDGPAARLPEPDRVNAAKPARDAAGTAVFQPEEIARLQEELRVARVERDVALDELRRNRGPAAPAPAPKAAPPEPDPPAVSATSLAATELPAIPANPPAPAAVTASSFRPPAARVPAPQSRQFTGFWFFMKPAAASRSRNTEMYPPEFIEATISEQNGMVRGRYRSRYRIVDRAISPDVNFEFACAPNGNSFACPWTGAGGSKGQLLARITPENTLKIDWRTTDLGATQGLVSGTATLTKRID